MKLVCLELAQLEQQAEAENSPGAPSGQLPARTARLLRDSACNLTLDLCQQLHQVRHQDCPWATLTLLNAAQAMEWTAGPRGGHDTAEIASGYTP